MHTLLGRRVLLMLLLFVLGALQTGGVRAQTTCASRERCSDDTSCYIKIGTVMPPVVDEAGGLYKAGTTDCGWQFCYGIFVCDCGRKFAKSSCYGEDEP